MSNDYFKAQGWFKNYATSSEDSRGVFQELVKEDEEAFRLASAETDRIKAMMNEKYGPGTVKYGSEIKQPEIKTPQAAFEFSQRNPAAEGGRMGFYKGTDPELMKLFKQLVKKQAKRSVKQIGWNREKLLNLSNYLNNTGKTLDEYLEMNPSDRNKVNKAELTGVGKGAGQTETETTKKFRKWLAKQDPKTLKADSVQDLIRQANIEGVSMDKGTVKGIPRDKIISIVRENPQFENVTIRNWNEMDKVSDTAFTRSYEPDNPKYSGVYETTSKTGNKTYYGIVQRNKDTIKKFFPTPEEAADFVTEERKNPTSQEFAGEKKIETRDFPNRKTPSKKRIDALKENSSYGFEKATTGDLKSNTVGGHTGSIYAETQTPKTKKYTDSRINAALESYDNALSAITEKRDAALKAGDFAEVERLNQKGMNYAAATEGYKTFTVRNMDGTSFLSGSTDKGAVDFMDLMDPNITAKDITNFGTAYGGQNAPVNKAKFELKNALEKYGKNSEEVKAAKQNLMDINAVEQEKLFREGTNKSLLEVQKEPGMKSSKLTKPEVEATIKRLQSNFKDLRKNPNKAITDKKIMDYITDRTGKVKPPSSFIGASSGFNTDLIAEDLKKIMDTEGFKSFKANIADPALEAAGKAVKVGSKVAALPTKIFGGADVVFGYFDYLNNEQKGYSDKDAIKHMIDATLINTTSFGEKADIEGVRKIANKNGMSNEVFDNLMAVNTNQKKFMDTVSKSKAKFNESMDIIESGAADPTAENMLIQKLKVDTKKSLTNTMENIVKDSRSLETNLQVQEAGAPININVDKEKAFSDLGSASRDFVQTRIDASDPKVFEQGDTTMGKIGSTIKNTLMQPDFYTGFFKKTGAQKKEEDMQKLKIQDPTLYYKMLQSEGIDPRINLNIPVQLEFEQKYPQFGNQMSDTLTQNKAEGGITGLRSKYEYKK